MREQELARRRDHRAGASADEQRRAQLALQRADLLRDRGLAQGQGVGGAGERALARDLAEGQQPARVEHPLSLSVAKIDDLRLCG
jgi:hypothetical protein